MKIILVILILCGAIIPMVAITKEDSAAMRREADVFLGKMPVGMQAKQQQAVVKAIEGDVSQLNQIRDSRNASPHLPEQIKVKDFVIDGGCGNKLPVRLFSPARQDEALPLLIYFHGGGWTFGSLNSCSSFCGTLAADGNVAVLAVDYSLAPEHPFPEGLKDCVAAIEYAFSHSAELNALPSAISVGGDSSGGNLALAAAIYNNDNARLPIKSLVLFYPVLKAEKDASPSWADYANGFGLDAELMLAFNDAYTSGNCAANCIEYLSPIYASEAKLKMLPDMLMINAERDILTGQGDAFSARCATAGVNMQRHIFPGAVHLFITVPGQPSAFRKSIDLTSAFLQ